MVPEQKVQCIPYTTCHMVTENHVRYVTQRRCHMVPEEKVRCIPYTTCKMIPEEHCRMETRRRCYMVPEEKIQCIPYTTCHMVTENHVRYVTQRRCYMVPEVKVQCIPYTTCKMVPEEHCEVVKCRRCHMVSEEKVQCIPYTTCHMVPEEHCKLVPTTVCKLEPECYTYKVCRQVPVCVPTCEPVCPPPCLPAVSCGLPKLHEILSRFGNRAVYGSTDGVGAVRRPLTPSPVSQRLVEALPPKGGALMFALDNADPFEKLAPVSSGAAAPCILFILACRFDFIFEPAGCCFLSPSAVVSSAGSIFRRL